MNYKAVKRMRGEVDKNCNQCNGTGVVDRAFWQGGSMKVRCEWCFEDTSRCSTCGGKSMDCYGIHD